MMPARKKTSAPLEKELASHRKAIDTLDDELIALLTERSAIVEKVGQLKHKMALGGSFIRPGREAEIVRRVIHKTHSRISRPAMGLIWRLIISSSIAIEEEVSIASLSNPGNDECYWVAREHFGAFTSNRRFPTKADILREVLSRRATVGVLPLLDPDSLQPWWSRVTEEKKPPHVFARLPFVRLAPSAKPPIVAIGHVKPEPTRDDCSLWVIKADEMFPFKSISAHLRKAEIEHESLEQCRVIANPTLRYNLLSVPGFVNGHSPLVQKFLKKVNLHNTLPVPVEAFFLGAYANPVTAG